ncbi:TonB-dependent receptor [Fluviicola taffensis]|uniref:TonB-dependent receptor n=1 Tax=Fluviicola taffensis (strain DSM 16823 / NCIMB 13979 / RW262) TaxID=755732 RepID=F2IFV7_FLUTR|nr:TonB-dependent receptor [Fluviicola taffensis]AEA43578.1 hypothetical protein Fluta_1586 [Fluviicola taffensis DSM 16823]
MKRGTHILTLVSAVLIGSFSNLFGQEGNEVILVTEGNRSIETAYRQTSQPKILDTVFPTPTTSYPLLSINYEPTFEIPKIEPAKVNLQQKLPQLYNGYARIGIGSILMPLAEVYYNNGRSRKLNYGGHLHHISSFGKMRNVAPANFDRTNVRGFVGINEKKYSWDVESYYRNQGLHFYGFPNENANKDSIAQRFNTFGLKGGFHSHAHDSLGLNWKLGLEYRHFNDKKPKADSLKDWNARENFFAIRAGGEYKWGREIFAVDLDILHNSYKYGVLKDSIPGGVNVGLETKNTIISLKPSISTYSKNLKLKAKIGVDLTASLGAKNKVYIYPIAEVKYSLFNDILIPYAGVTGGLTQQSFKKITDENEFSLSNVSLQNEHKAADGFVGIKGTLSKRIGFNAFISFSHVKNKALFVTDTVYSGRNRFNVIYDTMNITKIEGSIYYQLKEKVKIDLIGRYYSYSAKNNIFAWNLPQVQFILRGSYNLYDKFILTADVSLEGGRRVQVFAAGDDVLEENNQYALKMGFLADANISLEYRYNKRVSAFLNLNNVAAQRYKRWYNYPTQGFQAMIGVTFRF